MVSYYYAMNVTSTKQTIMMENIQFLGCGFINYFIPSPIFLEKYTLVLYSTKYDEE